MDLDLDVSKYLDWNESDRDLPKKAKKCKKRPTQIHRISNKVQNTSRQILARSSWEAPPFTMTAAQPLVSMCVTLIAHQYSQ